MELASPITIYWDVAPGDPSSDTLNKICTDVLAVRPLMVQLYDAASFLGAGIRSVLEQLRGTPVAVILTITPACLATLGELAVDTLGVKEILQIIEHPDELKFITATTSIGVSCPVTQKNWRELPAIIASCRERGFSRLVLPMQRLCTDKNPFFLSKYEQEELERALAVIGGAQDLKLTIHDPFLWRPFNPGVPFPQGGCQAANTMIAISSDGGVYPCPTLPVRLGELGAASLQDILASRCKKDFRRSLLLHPEACRDCADVAECKGGCRGRAYVMHNSLDGVDDSCR
jgi:GeoRSP system SPASM domain protein